MQSKSNINKETHILIMGVSACGKSSVAKELGSRLFKEILEADDFHSSSNINKMSNGIELTDLDREPWLKALNKELQSKKEGVVLSCSALKEDYRRILFKDINNFLIVFLVGDFSLIQNRLKKRKGHFMSMSLLQSQFDSLERPIEALEVSIDQSLDNIIDEIVAHIER